MRRPATMQTPAAMAAGIVHALGALENLCGVKGTLRSKGAQVWLQVGDDADNGYFVGRCDRALLIAELDALGLELDPKGPEIH